MRTTELRETGCKRLFLSSSGRWALQQQLQHSRFIRSGSPVLTLPKLLGPVSGPWHYVPFVSFSTCFWISMSTLKWTYVSSFLKATGVSCTGVRSIPFRSAGKKQLENGRNFSEFKVLLYEIYESLLILPQKVNAHLNLSPNLRKGESCPFTGNEFSFLIAT